MHPRIQFPGELSLLLLEAAEVAARAAARQGRAVLRGPRRRGLTLRPSSHTPLWNELLARAQPHLRHRGTKARLARLLGLPRQRLQDCLKARTALLDAERTLLFLCWLAAREQGRELGAPPVGGL